MSISTDPPDAVLYHGTYIELVCNATVSKQATNTTISTSWTGPRGNILAINREGYTIIDKVQMPGTQNFISRLRIEQLMISRDNKANYSCIVDVAPSFISPLVLTASSTAMDTLVVSGEL